MIDLGTLKPRYAKLVSRNPTVVFEQTCRASYDCTRSAEPETLRLRSIGS